jgi:hypothetical protein
MDEIRISVTDEVMISDWVPDSIQLPVGGEVIA